MRVHILSGNQAGQVVEQTDAEAAANIAAGFAEPVTEVEAPSTTPVAEAAPKPSEPDDDDEDNDDDEEEAAPARGGRPQPKGRRKGGR